jgi:hypothetical protein
MPHRRLARVHKLLARTHKSLPSAKSFFVAGWFCYARPKERKPNLDDEVALLRLALGVALGRFEDSLDGEAPQLLHLHQPAIMSEAIQTARTMIEQLSVPGVVVRINARGRSRN